jgi:hypothetical protein
MASIPLTITNGTAPYTISVKMVGDGNERFLGYSSNVLSFTADNSGDPKTYNVTVTDSLGCIKTGIIELECSVTISPSFQWEFLQPYCSSVTGGSIVNGTLKLKNIVNGTRYKICYGSQTFSPACNANCATSDGFIIGTTSDIPIIAPAQGQSQYVTVRVYNGDGCTGYTDISFGQYSQRCSADETSMIIVDLRMNMTNVPPNITPCAVPANILYDYNFYAQVTNLEIAENNQKATIKTDVSQRNVPNNNEVPNMFISAAKSLGCGPGPFYRFGFNISNLKAAYPATTVFTFDIYVEKRVGGSGGTCTGGSCSVITPQTNMFKGVRLIKQDYPAVTSPPAAYNANCCFSDFFREPLYNGDSIIRPGHIYNHAITGYRKLGTLTFNYGNNTTSWATA